jgi:tripartite-type tricarboxylate transporter receptor subunit TctC
VQRLPTDDSKTRLGREGIEVQTSTPAELSKLVAEEYAKWVRVIRAANIRVD